MTLERLQRIAEMHAQQRAIRRRADLLAFVETTLGVSLAPWQLTILEDCVDRRGSRSTNL